MTRNTTAPEAELELVVARRTDEADGVVSLDLRRPDGASLPAWAPGAHIDLLPAPDLVRQYSLCSSPEEAEVWRVAVLLEKHGRGGSLHVHDTLAEGDAVRCAVRATTSPGARRTVSLHCGRDRRHTDHPDAG